MPCPFSFPTDKPQSDIRCGSNDRPSDSAARALRSSQLSFSECRRSENPIVISNVSVFLFSPAKNGEASN